jgi:CDP-glycerol glycerophosphotransferase (TagB/SpsB family)
MVYSLGAMTWNVSNVMKHYDTLFVYGPHEEELYRKHFGDNMKIHQVGYPKFDDFFNNNLPKLECEKKLNKNLKTILWLPTKNLLSSIPKYSEMMKRLSSKYNVILKPHPQENPQFLELINHSNIILSEHHDSAPFYKLADFVFCDYGGSAFGAIYCDKPVVFLSPDNPEKDSINYSATSPEVFLRNYFLTLTNESENEIVSCLEDKNYWLSDSNIRAKLREQFFLNNFGNSGKTAAMQLKKLLRTQR